MKWENLTIFVVLAMFFSLTIAAKPTSAIDLSGRILLDVENHGEAWYVNPDNGLRYFLGRPSQAFEIMTNLGLGVTNKTLSEIYDAGDSATISTTLAQKLSGKILLQVEEQGQAWYVNPIDLKKYYLGRPDDAFFLMKQLGLGITAKNLSTIMPSIDELIDNDIPFTAQAPFGDWADQRQQEGCEEASVLMAKMWLEGKDELDLHIALQEILAVSDWQKKEYGYFEDTSAFDTYERIVKKYYGITQAEYKENIQADDILFELQKGNIVLITVNGKKLYNSRFENGGPLRHMLVVKGYDPESYEFITNEPGTRYGGNYRYSYQTINNALRDYPSGVYKPITDESKTAMIIFKK